MGGGENIQSQGGAILHVQYHRLKIHNKNIMQAMQQNYDLYGNAP